MRRGATLAELIVAVTLASVVLGMATASLMRQQRTSAGLAARSAVEAQLRPGTASVAAQLALLSPAAGDLVPGEWRDSAIQFRAPVAVGISCARAAGQVTVALDAGDAVPLSGVLSPPRGGDSLWWYSDSTAAWVGRLVTGTATLRGACGAARPASILALSLAGGDSLPAAAPLRVTRQLRLVVYRGSDGWTLGLREWSDASQALTSPQPIAGPFASALGTGERTGFRYFGASGEELQVERDPAAAVRRIRLTLLATRRAGEAIQRDSVDVAVQAGHAP